VGGTGEAWRFGFNFAYVEDDGREGANGGCGGRRGGGGGKSSIRVLRLEV
jgi:hypothetical protein